MGLPSIIDRDYFEEKFAHVMTKLETLQKGQEKTEKSYVECVARCSRDMEDVYTRLRKEETRGEVHGQWIQDHKDKESERIKVQPHWIHAYGLWVKVGLTAAGMIGGALVTIWMIAAQHADKLQHIAK